MLIRLRSATLGVMRMILATVVYALLLCGLFSKAFAQGTYPKIEAAFTVNKPIADPFDYSNDLRVLIVQTT